MVEIFSILGKFLSYAEGTTLSLPKSKAAQHIKIAHASEVANWESIPSYEAFEGCSLSDYYERENELSYFSNRIGNLLKLHRRKQKLCTADLVEYENIEIDVAGDFLRRNYNVTLPKPKHNQTKITCSQGIIDGDLLSVRKGVRRQTVRLTYACPSSEANKDEIDEIDQQFQETSQGDMWMLNECLNSIYTQPILFISHRWEDPSHPDPNGSQLSKLANLKDCFILYDYFSFPQDMQTEEARTLLGKILRDMTALICNVVILDSQSYVERGWCFYEYLIASLKKELVCDEIGAKEFVALRDLVYTEIPPSYSSNGDTIESWLYNAKGRNIIELVNLILPRFNDSGFTVENDRQIVRELLVEGLLKALPDKQKHTPYIGWQPSGWRREEIERAFMEPLEPQFEHSPIEFKPEDSAVYQDIDAAVAGQYRNAKKPLPASLQDLEIKRWSLMGGSHK